MNILEGFSAKDDLIEFICTKCKYTLWVPRFIVEQLEEDNIFNGLNLYPLNLFAKNVMAQ